MADITTIWDVDNGRGDWAMAGPSLQSGNDLETAVLISLFTDRQAEPSDVILDGSGDPRGWWADQGAASPIGSRLWLLDRACDRADVPVRANAYITEALAWLIEDGVATSVDVATEFTTPTMLGCAIAILRSSGEQVVLNYAWAWNGIG
jgi:phage gp46-like protein